MARLAAEWRISIKHNPSGETYKIELIRFPVLQRRWFVRFNGKRSKKFPDGTLSEIFALIRTLLVKKSNLK